MSSFDSEIENHLIDIADSNINIILDKEEYNIHIKGSLVFGAGKSNTSKFPALKSLTVENNKMTKKSEALILSNKISKKLDLSVHLTKVEGFKRFYLGKVSD